MVAKFREKMDVEQALKIVGSFGRYQAFSYVCIASLHCFLAWQMVQMLFVGAKPVMVESSREITKPEGMTSIVSEWQLQDKMWVVNLIQSIFMLGVLVGNLVIGQLSDKYGRKVVLIKVVGLLIFTSFLTAFTNNYQTLAAIRFFVGVFEGGTVLVAFVLAQELLGSSVWTITGNIMPALFAFGIASLAGLASLFPNWRDLCLATSLPGLVLLLSLFAVPESPRWLYSQGKLQEAEEVLHTMARRNGISKKDCSSIVLSQSRNTSEKRKSGYTLIHLFSSKVLTVRTLVMGFLWFVCSFAYYGLTMGAGDLSSNLYTSVALSGLVELPSYVICGILIDRRWAGRRRTLSGMLLFGGISCMAIVFVHLNPDGTSTMKLAFALAGKLAVSASFSTVYIYASELFPTVIRNVAMGSSSMCARIGGILAPFVPALSQYGPSVPFVVFGIASLAAGVSALILPETLHQPIPATLEDITDHKTTKSSYKTPKESDQEQLLPV